MMCEPSRTFTLPAQEWYPMADINSCSQIAGSTEPFVTVKTAYYCGSLYTSFSTEAAKVVGGKAAFPVFAPGEAKYPAGVAPITPQSYREHLRASKALETAPEERKADLQKVLLSKEQLAALDHMKKHTDFNDLATKSSLGREGVERQVRATVGKAVQEAERKREQKQAEQQVHKQKRSARIGY